MKRGDWAMKLSDFLARQAIIMDLVATTRDDAIREIVRSLQDAGHLADLDPDSLTGAILEREGLGSTAIGHGVAVPHGWLPSVDRVIGTIALSRHGVGFNAVDGEPLDVLVLMFHPPLTGKPVRPDDP